MKEAFKARKITDNVYWVGAIDWTIRDFHGYATKRGTTYNAFLVLADKTTLIDTVKAPFRDELLGRISSVTDPENIDYVISNHSEMDHSGCIANILRIAKPEKVFASPRGKKALSNHLIAGDEVETVKDGDTLDLGDMKLRFMETPMLHWPDSMVSYLEEEKLLFSQDGFGMHLASSGLWTGDIDRGTILYESAKYYANILMPFSPIVGKILDKLEETGWKPEIIAPDHGPCRRNGGEEIIALYREWSAGKPKKKAVVVYDTMWNSTEIMAKAVAGGIMERGIKTELIGMRASHRSDVATEILDAGALIVGAPTLNNQLFPTLADLLTYLKGLKPKNLIGAVFGSYGWSGESVKQLKEYLTDMNIEITGEVSSRYVPDDEKLKECRKLGTEIAGKLAEIAE